MAKIVCLLDGNLIENDDCNQKKGIRRLFVAQRSLIDWEAMRSSTTKFDPNEEVILGYTYRPGGAHYEVTFDRTTATGNATYTSDNGLYDNLLTVILRGNSAERTRQLKRWIACCDLTVHAIMANGTERVYGVEYDGEVFDQPLTRMRVSRHLDSPGQFSGDDARDELDFGGQQEFAPLFARVGTQALRDSVQAAQGASVYGEPGNGTAYGDGSGDGSAFGERAVSGAAAGEVSAQSETKPEPPAVDDEAKAAPRKSASTKTKKTPASGQ